jgi:hypothetical protein
MSPMQCILIGGEKAQLRVGFFSYYISYILLLIEAVLSYSNLLKQVAILFG